MNIYEILVSGDRCLADDDKYPIVLAIQKKMQKAFMKKQSSKKLVEYLMAK